MNNEEFKDFVRSEFFMRLMYLLAGVLLGLLFFLSEYNSLIARINELIEFNKGCFDW